MDKPYIIQAAGCVLSGGKSSRMGTDKALLELGGKTLIEIALESFSDFPEIFISSKDAGSYSLEKFPVIPDEQPGIGPLGGLISALNATDYDLVCFRPVDAPFVPAGLHRLLANLCSDREVAVPIFKGSIEPLLACVSKAALITLNRQAQKGTYKVADAFSLCDTLYVPLDKPDMRHRFGNPSEYLINVNDPLTFAKLGKR